MKKLKVIVLSGGPSAEHDISLKTGAMVAKALDRSKYEIEELIIGRDGYWPAPPQNLKADVVFIAMHGEYGEDGTVQKILEDAGLRYTGSGSQASRLGMDKIKSAEVFRDAGLLVPYFVVVEKSDRRPIVRQYPVVIKPADRGSSVGVSVVKKADDLTAAFKKAFEFSNTVIIQEFIKGREITCGVLDDGKDNAMALPPTEIIPPENTFFDFEAKYNLGASREITPPNLPAKTIKDIQETALKAHKAVGCSGMSRTDMIIEKSKVYILEINTIPGMTETSLLPQEAKAANINFPQLLDHIITAAVNKN